MHVMIDIETLGTNNEAVILSIGACKFEPNNHRAKIKDSFYVAIDPTTCTNAGLKMDAATIMWWLDSEQDSARAQMMKDQRLDLSSALDGFSAWFGDTTLPVWGNGATFDSVILRTAYQKVGEAAPWQFWHDRCYRTIKSLAPDVKLVRVGTHHNALDDAISQAQHLQKIVYQTRIKV